MQRWGDARSIVCQDLSRQYISGMDKSHGPALLTSPRAYFPVELSVGVSQDIRHSRPIPPIESHISRYRRYGLSGVRCSNAR